MTDVSWREVHDDAVRCWILDLDGAVFSVHHRRLCVWQDEFNLLWCWEIETYDGLGCAARGTASSRESAMREGELAARRQGGS
ncbi:hypothetical protein D3C87_1053340 [compost metagenome]|jgi:hypothetical protein|uniref:Uncharacterized protein n=1 Tax=Cupriavidus campinensis TaxID=151783 RepID=A0AAE9L3K6_9BURK|nr:MULTISPECIES: hypothetical protein [Cupriavidus]TSP14266.1 hypothetical protein FGG12_00970 [Cupriavidus campinensis]URF05696.1 hypothetical protein M5D45_07840 [Cupriavidus campinensis]CAG2144380.1 hypothetical protein LMG19282_02571 [Cupriavidus campinensis]